MVISWLGTLAVLLNQFWRAMFRVECIEESYTETVKRFGAYYFCIDDLPL
jgi:hypothetical protein